MVICVVTGSVNGWVVGQMDEWLLDRLMHWWLDRWMVCGWIGERWVAR